MKGFSMSRKNTLERARFIFTTGKMIHDHVFRIYVQRLADKGKQAGSDELSISQLQAIKATHGEGPVTITRLAEILGVSAPSASAMVDRLVERGYLTRQPHPRDRRKVHISVSGKAEEQIAQAEKQVLTSFVEIVDRIGPDIAQKWCDVLKTVSGTLEDMDTGADRVEAVSRSGTGIKRSA